MKTLHIFTLSTTACAFFDGQFEYLTQQGHVIHVVSSAGDMDAFCERNYVSFFPHGVPKALPARFYIPKTMRRIDSEYIKYV